MSALKWQKDRWGMLAEKGPHLHDACQAHVPDFGGAVPGQQYVGRLEVKVDDALGVEEHQALGDVYSNLQSQQDSSTCRCLQRSYLHCAMLSTVRYTSILRCPTQQGSRGAELARFTC